MLKRGWVVTAAGLGLNLALGILYAWSMFSKQMTEALDKGGFGWSRTQATLPYTIAIACFALMMVPAGRLQDKLGPRLVATIGGAMCGIGLIISSFATAATPLIPIIGFGLVTGTGLGLGYAAATPAAVKWFPPQKKGLITGLVVAGFGIAPVYIAPLSKYLLGEFGIPSAFRILGIAFAVGAVLVAQLMVNPEKPLNVAKPGATKGNDVTWKEMLRRPTFYVLWLEYAFAATAGLMIIGHLAKIVGAQSGGVIKAGFIFVALLAVFNASGRIIAGIVSDRIGRMVTLALVCVLQAINMFFFAQYETTAGFIFGAAIVGFCYGSCLSLFPSTAADEWGTKNLGLNYGLLFTAWGVGGVIGPMLAGKIADATGSYEGAYHFSAALQTLAFLLAMLSYVNVSVNVPDRELTIRLGKRAGGTEAA